MHLRFQGEVFMLLKDLVSEVDIKLDEFQEEIEIKNIEISLENVKKGDLFFDLKGDQNINKAIDKGASFVIKYGKKNKSEGKRVFIHSDPRRLFALLSKKLCWNACDKLKIIGITGTNGKTSITKLVADILKSVGKKVGTIGTMGCEFLGRHIETGFTTPDPNLLHSLFLKMYRSGVEYVVMEVSAHSIFLKKLEGIRFEILALTNITQDHLDFFGSMENYASTKLSFFKKEHAKQGVICIDDPFALRLLGKTDIPLITYGVENPSDIFAIDMQSEFSGSEFICNCLDEVFRIDTRLVGDYNILNCLCAIAVARLLGVEIDDIVDGVASSQPESGRFNIISFSGINVVIDYAHTPDGLEKILQTAKPLCKGKLNLLFGCGGNRDTLKRPIMGGISESYADKVFLTSDNPRFEDPLQIIRDIECGMSKQNHEVCVDRKIAIYTALSNCNEGDCLIIAGKGAEKYQDIKGQKFAYSDFDEIFKFFRGNLKVLEQNGRLKHGC